MCKFYWIEDVVTVRDSSRSRHHLASGLWRNVQMFLYLTTTPLSSTRPNGKLAYKCHVCTASRPPCITFLRIQFNSIVWYLDNGGGQGYFCCDVRNSARQSDNTDNKRVLVLRRNIVDYITRDTVDYIAREAQ